MIIRGVSCSELDRVYSGIVPVKLASTHRLPCGTPAEASKDSLLCFTLVSTYTRSDKGFISPSTHRHTPALLRDAHSPQQYPYLVSIRNDEAFLSPHNNKNIEMRQGKMRTAARCSASPSWPSPRSWVACWCCGGGERAWRTIRGGRIESRSNSKR